MENHLVQIAIALFPELTSLDAVGPYQVFSYLPGSEVVICAARTGVVVDDAGVLRIDVTRTFDDVSAPDVVVVPGGQIVYRMIRDRDPIIEWIRAIHAHTTYTTSVCTGSLLLGAAGLLDGLRATTHWSAYDTLASLGANPTEERVVEQGKIVTAAGVSSGIDLALALVGKIAGDETARAVQLGIEYDPQPPYDAGAPSKAAPDIQNLVRDMLDLSRDEVLRRP
jgi:transcriptional regulator GlxA family with amidase domain